MRSVVVPLHVPVAVLVTPGKRRQRPCPWASRNPETDGGAGAWIPWTWLQDGHVEPDRIRDGQLLPANLTAPFASKGLPQAAPAPSDVIPTPASSPHQRHGMTQHVLTMGSRTSASRVILLAVHHDTVTIVS